MNVEPRTGEKRLLFINFDFPPRRTSGVYRMRALAKYLWKDGWNPTVLAVEGPVAVWYEGEKNEDPELLRGFPTEIPIVRTPYFDLRGWEKIHPRNAQPAVQTSSFVQSSAEAVGAQPPRPSLLKRLARWTAKNIRSFLYFPDPTTGWVPSALLAAIRMHRKQPFTAVFTSNPPRSPLVIGLLFTFLYKVPWTAEFMDPWHAPEGPIRRRIERWFLRLIVRRADCIVVMTDAHAAALRAEFGPLVKRVEVIPNGFDETDFSNVPDVPRPPSGVRRFTHVGTIYGGTAGRFYDAITELVTESPELSGKFHIDIIGSMDDPTTRFAASPIGRELLTFHGYRPHALTLGSMFATDYLLLFLSDHRFSKLHISSKIYEYLRVGKPIVAVTYPGGVQSLVDRSGAGVVLPPDDVDGIKVALRKLVCEEPQLGAWREFADQFRFDRLAAKLGGVMDELVDRRG